MGTARASNKDILEAINGLTAAITSSMASPAIAAPSVATPVDVPAAPKGEVPSDLQIDKGYLNHMATKCQAFANDKGTDVVEYARHNLGGETKLAYCSAERFAGLKDRGFIGTVAYYSPE